MTIVLISIHVEKTPPAFPLAAAVIKTALKHNQGTAEFDVIMKEYYLPINTGKAAEELLKTGASAFGFSACTWNSAEIIKIAAGLRKSNKRLLLFTGGPHPSADSSRFAETGLFDFIVIGEAEKLIAETLLNPPRQKSAVLHFPPAGFTESESPYPAVISPSRQYDGVLWEITRGCPYNCAFCYESRGNKTIRTITNERIERELQLFKNNGIEKIWVLDPTFNHNRKHAETVLELIAKNYPDAHYTFEIRAELMTEKLCGLFAELDVSLQIGLQTTNNAALTEINRNLNSNKFLEKCKLMSGYGLTFGLDLIYGLPFDNYESFMKSLDFAVSTSPNNIDIFPLSVLPGTELTEKSKTLGLHHEGFPSYQLIECNSFSRSDMRKAEKLTAAVDMLYNREQAFPWFGTAAAALSLTPSELFEKYTGNTNIDAVVFFRREFHRAGLDHLFPVVDSLIRWSRTAEEAFQNPGKPFQVVLCRKPEILDELSNTDPETFLRRYPSGKNKNYSIYFDGEDLYIN